MSSTKRLVTALSLVLPGSTLSASVVLALAAGSAAAQPNPDATNASRPATAPSAARQGTSERLRAIRAAVGQLARPQQGAGSADTEMPRDSGASATWWGNGGWGRWRFGWGNGGWGWPNGWHNWGNGWNNWGNGWHNYWHNY